MLIKSLRICIVGVVLVSTGCGKTSKGGNGLPKFVNALAQGSDSIGYGVRVLASTKKSAPSLSNLNSSSATGFATDFAVAETQDPNLPDCGTFGSAWERGVGRMPVSHEKFSETTFYCQLNSAKSPDQLVGALKQYQAVLCSVEAAIGSIDYSEAGNQYNNQSLTLSEACGWDGEMVNQTWTANVSAYAIATGDWQKRIHVKIPSQSVDFDVYFTIRGDVVAFKTLEAWSRSHDHASSVAGVRGSVVAIDIVNGVLRAESTDTFWSRRYRIFMKGQLDQSTGLFSSISDGQGVVANFDYQDALYAEIATVNGNDSEGYLHGNYSFSGNPETIPTSLPTVAVSSTRCSISGACQGLEPIAFSGASSDFDFLMIGVVWDSKGGKRSTIESWLTSAGFPAFSSVSKSVTAP